MFDFLNIISMIGTYEDRMIAPPYDDEEKRVSVSTVRVTDSFDPMETAVQHPKYRDGKWIIVQTYTNVEDAKKGHEHWVATMTADELPESLKDVSTSSVIEFGKETGFITDDDMVFRRQD